VTNEELIAWAERKYCNDHRKFGACKDAACDTIDQAVEKIKELIAAAN